MLVSVKSLSSLCQVSVKSLQSFSEVIKFGFATCTSTAILSRTTSFKIIGNIGPLLYRRGGF